MQCRYCRGGTAGEVGALNTDATCVYRGFQRLERGAGQPRQKEWQDRIVQCLQGVPVGTVLGLPAVILMPLPGRAIQFLHGLSTSLHFD